MYGQCLCSVVIRLLGYINGIEHRCHIIFIRIKVDTCNRYADRLDGHAFITVIIQQKVSAVRTYKHFICFGSRYRHIITVQYLPVRKFVTLQFRCPRCRNLKPALNPGNRNISNAIIIGHFICHVILRCKPVRNGILPYISVNTEFYCGSWLSVQETRPVKGILF